MRTIIGSRNVVLLRPRQPSNHIIKSPISKRFSSLPLKSIHQSRPSVSIAITRIAAQRGEDPAQAQRRREDSATILGSALTMTSLVLLAIRFGGPALQQFDAWDGVGGLTPGDLLGAFFWSVSLYFASPWQLLLLFLGKLETERPSDWVLRKLGLASGLDVDAIDYQAPLPLKIATLSFFVISGVVTATALDSALGDGTWSVSTGIGSLFLAGLYEVGRPDRLSTEEAQVLEKQWQDFASFADDALLPRGRCHESEVFKAFRSRFGRYRTQEALNDARIRDMIRNWNRGVERTRTGYYKNLSLKTVQEREEMRQQKEREQLQEELNSTKNTLVDGKNTD